MRIAVLGTGIVGRTLAGRLDGLGHETVIGTRDVAATLARGEPDAHGTPPYRAWADGHPNVGLAGFAGAAGPAEIVINATSGTAAQAALAAAGEDALAGKVLLDVANPLSFRGGAPVIDPVNTDSLGERIQRDFPSARVVKTLNTMNCEVMVDPGRVPGDHNVFVCGNDAAAKDTAREILASFGWPAGAVIDLGDITAARGTEMWLPLWLRLMGTFGSADFNVHIQRA